MIYGIILGAGAGMTVTALCYIWVLSRVTRQSREDSKVVEELLRRQTEASEELVAEVQEYVRDNAVFYRAVVREWAMRSPQNTWRS